MPDGLEPETAVSATATEPSTRLRSWAARRFRQGRWVVLALAFVLACGAAGVMIWRSVSLIRLPDVGDPFDVAAEEAIAIPEDRDAFAYFRRAEERLGRMPDIERSVRLAGPVGPWSKADPGLRRWVESNGEAMELFRRGAAQADGIAHPGKQESAFQSQRAILVPYYWLVLLEASRLEERGEMAEAWACYRALLEMRAHVMRRGESFERFFAEHNIPWLQQRIAAWAADPRTDVAALHRALDDVIRTRPRPEWEASSLRVGYLLAMRELDQPSGVLKSGDDDDLSYRIAGENLPPNLAQTAYTAWRFVHNEPERSRRVLRLVFANWLSHIEDTAVEHRRPVVRASFRDRQGAGVSLYPFGPNAPAGASRMPLTELAAWILKAHDVRWLVGQWTASRIKERQDHRTLTVLLAEALYRRERGASPPSEQALVGPYLDGLPDDVAADLDDGSALVVQEQATPGAGGRSP